MKTFDLILTKNFKLSEFLVTNQKFDNFELSYRTFQNICKLVCLLQDLRDFIGVPVIITSGYRPETLNAMVDGVKNSFHLCGSAADVFISNREKYNAAVQYLTIRFNQDDSIAEFLCCPEKQWFHISLNCHERKNKHVINLNYY